MVGWVRWTENWRFRPQVTQIEVLGFPLLAVNLPAGNPARRGKQAVKLLRRHSISRALLPPELRGIFPTVNPQSLCRAKGAELALALLEEVPLRERRIALRGERVDRLALRLADALCPQVCTLYLNFDRGGEELSEYLRTRYGVSPPGQTTGGKVQFSIDLSPCAENRTRVLKLWGEPDLLGLELSFGEELPNGLPKLLFLTLLWESGRIQMEDILIKKP